MCGVWGFSSGKVAKKATFSWDKFNILGIFNDDRGGDACGRVHGQMVHHDNSVNRRYPSLISSFYSPETDNNATTIFGHARKGSIAHSGKKGIEFTQPAVIRDANSDINKIGVHNGTLYNVDDIKDKYNIPKKAVYINNDESIQHEYNDSQMLLWILAHKKDYSILKYYQGTAALAWYDYDTKELFLWSGESKVSTYSDNTSRERPLYILEGENYIWFSSLKEPLDIISDKKDDKIYEIDTNTIYVIKNGKIKSKNSSEDFNRLNSLSSRQYKSNYSSDNYSSSIYSKKSNEPNEVTNLIKKALTQGLTKNVNTTDFLAAEEIPEWTIKEERIFFARNKYWFRGKHANGIMHIDEDGYINKVIHKVEDNAKAWPRFFTNEHDKSIVASKHGCNNTRPYYFVDGIMMRDHVDFNKAIRIYKELKSSNTLDHIITTKLSKYTNYAINSDNVNGSCVKYENKDWKYYSGSFQPLFSSHIYEFAMGKFVLRSPSTLGFSAANHSIVSSTDNDASSDSPSDDDCKWCDGEGYDSYGAECFICGGSGKEKKKEIGSEDTAWTDTDSYGDMVKTEVARELQDVLQAVHSAKNNIATYTEHEVGESVFDKLIGVETLVEQIENKL